MLSLNIFRLAHQDINKIGSSLNSRHYAECQVHLRDLRLGNTAPKKDRSDGEPFTTLDSPDGRVVSASASEAVDLGLIPSRVKPMTLKLLFTASLLDALH